MRGNAQQVVEKYLALARDANTAGDRITAESYFQHAEHYYRLMMTANGGHEGHETRPRQHTGDYDDDRPQPAADGVSGAGDRDTGAAPAADGGDDSVSDPASAPQPDSGTNQAVPAE